MYNPATQLPPGFRFHPTDEELIVHYLRNRPAPVSIIAEIDIYKFDPWDLPEKAVFGDREWYFISPRERKYPNGVRPNRAAVSGYWKATGTDKFIRSGGDNVGVKKALVFYKGKPPKGLKTDWIMHEYRVAESLNTTNSYRPLSMKLTDDSMRLDDWVLCRIYKKSKHLSPPLIDREHEDSSTDDPSLPIQNLPLQQRLQDLPKTSSVSEALEDFSQLFNGFYNLHDLQRFDKNPLVGHPISSLQQTNHDSSDSNGYFLPQLSQKEPSDSIKLKNQKHDEMNSKEENNGTLQNFYGQFDSSHCSFPNQQFLRLPQPRNSHLGLQ